MKNTSEHPIRVIAIDIDGTLMNSRREISPETRDVLIKMQEAGAILVLASGRTDTWLLQLAKTLQMDRFNGFVVGFNGAKISKANDGKVLFDQKLRTEDVRKVWRHLKKFCVTVSAYDGEHKYIENREEHLSILVNGCGFGQEEAEDSIRRMILIEDLADSIDFPVYKLVVNGEANYLNIHREDMEAPVKDVMSTTFSAGCFCEFTDKDVSKATALSVILTELGVSAQELMAFGDAENDAAMLKMAGCGVAMGNASDKLKVVADEITLSNDEDGIAETIKRHFPNIFN